LVHQLVLVRAKPDSQSRFVAAAKKIKGVTDAYPVFGRFDVAVLVEGKTREELSRVTSELIALGGIKSTESMPEAE
jgi:DNA-binding Lrp family transcriptional regulator